MLRDASTLIYSTLLACFLAIFVFVELPFMEPDAPNHFRRAYQVAHAVVIGKKYGGFKGGNTPQSLYNDQEPYFDGYLDVKWKPKDDTSKRGRTSSINGPLEPAGFENTVIYEPLLYIPDAIGIRIGHIANLSIIGTIYVMRAVSAASCLLISVLSLIIIPRSRRFLLLFFLSIPQVAISYASTSYDGPFLAFSALATALLCRACESEIKREKKWCLVAAVIVLSILVVSKPPYAPILLFPIILLPYLKLNAKKLSAWLGVAFVPTIIWSIIGIAPFQIRDAAGHSRPHNQLEWLFHHPFSIFPISLRTVKHYHKSLLEQSIGTIRWAISYLPQLYYDFVKLILVGILLYFVTWLFRTKEAKRPSLLVAANLVAIVYAIAISIYLSWTVTGSPDISGINGRYFTVVMMFMPLLFLARDHVFKHRQVAEYAIACFFLPLSLLVTTWTLFSLNFNLP